MIISLKSRIYLTGWNERIGGRRVGVLLESDFSVHPSHWFSRILSPLSSSFRSSRVRRVIPAVVATLKPTVRFHVNFRNAHRYSIRVSVILPLSSFHESRYEVSSKTRYNLFLFLFFFSIFLLFCFKYYIGFLKSLLYRFPSSFCPSSHYVDSLLR